MLLKLQYLNRCVIHNVRIVCGAEFMYRSDVRPYVSSSESVASIDHSSNVWRVCYWASLGKIAQQHGAQQQMRTLSHLQT